MSDKWQAEYLRYIVRNKKRNKLVTDLVKELNGRGKHILVFVNRLEHLEVLHQMLKDIPHRQAFGKKSSSHRKQTIKDLQSGKIHLIIANKVFLKGVDIPRIDAIIDTAAGAKKENALQKLGRGTRLYAGKSGLLYFDISDRSNEGILNPFSKATGSRLRAFKKSNIPVSTVNPKELPCIMCIVDYAEEQLRIENKRLRREHGK